MDHLVQIKKLNVLSLVQQFITIIENRSNVNVKINKNNNCPEFCMSSFYVLKGISHQTNCIEIPQ